MQIETGLFYESCTCYKILGKGYVYTLHTKCVNIPNKVKPVLAEYDTTFKLVKYNGTWHSTHEAGKQVRSSIVDDLGLGSVTVRAPDGNVFWKIRSTGEPLNV